MLFQFLIRLRIWWTAGGVLGMWLAGSLPVGAQWSLIWSDEFGGTTLTATNWTFDIGNGSGGWGNNELEYYTSRPQNVLVGGGYLHLVAQKEGYQGFNYTSAKLKTLGLFSQRYGRFEFMAKLPTGQGYWPAIWMMPRDSVYGGWAASGEIDIVENRGYDPKTVLGTIHFGGSYPNQAQSYGPAFTFPANDSVTNFHLYALEWTTNAISWSVDGQVYERQTNWWSSAGAYPAPFDQPFYLILNLAVGGNFGGNPDNTTVFPGEMLVDYVRVYGGQSPPPPPPVLRWRVPLNEGPGSAVMTADPGGAGVNLQMLNGGGVAADFHGAANSGVGNPGSGNRALDFSNATGGQPGNPGPVAWTNSNGLGLGVLTNFVVSLWFKQAVAMATGANIGPRLFLLGNGSPTDTGAANSLGVKFQTGSQLYFQQGANTLSVNYANALPTNVWIFIAAAVSGSTVAFYQGTETNPAVLMATGSGAPVDLGTNATMFLGNRADRARAFNGSLADFRLTEGVADAAAVERIRQAGMYPPGLSLSAGSGQPQLLWPTGTLQRSPALTGPWGDVTNGLAPYPLVPSQPQEYYRLRY